MSISIVGGRLIDPANQIDEQLDVHIEGETIVAIGTAPEGFVAGQTIDASGQIVRIGLRAAQCFLVHFLLAAPPARGSPLRGGSFGVLARLQLMTSPPGSLAVSRHQLQSAAGRYLRR